MNKHSEVLEVGTDHREAPGWRRQTELVRGGLTRSPFDETSEAIYMTSGYVYESAEQAEAAVNQSRWNGVKTDIPTTIGGLDRAATINQGQGSVGAKST